MYLYPRLPIGVASSLARKWQEQDAAYLREQSQLDHESVIWTAVGGTRVQEEQLNQLRKLLRVASVKLGWPEPLNNNEKRNQFDRILSVLLYTKMEITPGEASREDVWSFITCVMLPDLVRWRFPGRSNQTDISRFIGGVRNTLQRLWWRTYVLHIDDSDNPFALVRQLKEDELVQIMERPAISGNRCLSQNLADSFISKVGKGMEGPRMATMREATKRLTRVSSIVALDTLESPELDKVISKVFTDMSKVTIE
jgi:hypothetical protein